MCVFAQSPADSLGTVPMSLEKCIEIALSENPTVKVAEMEITRVDYSKKEVIGQLFPNIAFSAQYSRALALQTMYMQMGEETVGVKMGRDNTATAGFTASMPVVAVQLWKSLKLSDAQIAQNIEAARSSRVNLVNMVKNAYYALLLANDSYKALLENHSMAQLTADVYQKKFEMGTASEFEVLRSSVAVKNIEPSILEAENTIKKLHLNLKVLMGIDVDTPITVAGELNDYRETLYEDILAIDTNISDNPDLRALDLQTDYLKKALDVQKAAWWPTLSLSYNYTWNGMNNGAPFKNMPWSSSSALALSLNFPLFQGGQRYYRIKQAEVSVNEMGLQRSYLENSLRSEVKVQIDILQKAARQIDVSALGVEQAQKANKIQEEAFRIGSGTFLDLRDSEIAVMTAKLSYFQAIHAYLAAKADLEKLLGKEK